MAEFFKKLYAALKAAFADAKAERGLYGKYRDGE